MRLAHESWEFFFAGFLLLVVVLMLRFGDYTGGLLMFFGLWTAAFVVFGMLIYLGRRIEWTSKKIVFLVVFGVVLRLILVSGDVVLSDDIYRYIWDGHVQTEGMNPYAFAPAALDGSGAWYHTLINHPSIPTSYPPLAQGLFFLLALFGESVVVFKLAFVLVEMGLMWLLYRFLLLVKGNVGNLVLYVLNPLVLVEVAWSGHLDGVAVALLMLGLYFLQLGKEWRGVVSMAASVLVKFIGVLGFPALLIGLKQKWRILGVVGLVGLGYIFYDGILSRGLHTYSRDWSFNGALFELLLGVVGNGFIVRYILLAIFLGGVGWVMYTKRNAVEVTWWTAVLYLLCTPSVHPWYTMILVPFLVLKFRWSTLWLCFAVGFSYLALHNLLTAGVWALPWWVLVIEWGVFVGLVVFEEWRRGER